MFYGDGKIFSDGGLKIFRGDCRVIRVILQMLNEIHIVHVIVPDSEIEKLIHSYAA